MKAAVSATELPKSSVNQKFTKNPSVSLFHLLAAPNTDFVHLTIDDKCHDGWICLKHITRSNTRQWNSQPTGKKRNHTSKQTPLNFETVKRLIKQEKFSQEAIASSNKALWQNIKTTWENKNKPRKQAVTNFRPNTGHNCLAAHLHHIKIFSCNYCTICKLKNTIMDKVHLLVCPKLDHTSKELSKLYWDARRLME